MPAQTAELCTHLSGRQSRGGAQNYMAWFVAVILSAQGIRCMVAAHLSGDHILIQPRSCPLCWRQKLQVS